MLEAWLRAASTQQRQLLGIRIVLEAIDLRGRLCSARFGLLPAGDRLPSNLSNGRVGTRTWEANMRSEDKHLLTAFGWLTLLVACFVVGMTGTFQELRKLTGEAGASKEFNISERQLRFQAADQLLAGLAHFAGERGLSVAVLSAPRPIAATEMAAIRERRTRADEALGRAQQHLAEIGRNAIRERIISRIAIAHDRVASLRSSVDREASKHIDQRTQLLASKTLEMPTALIEAMADLLRSIHRELGSSYPAMTGWLEVQRLIWEMAEYAGRERAQIAAFLATADGAPRTRLIHADRNHVQAVFAWKLAQLTMSTLSPPQLLSEQAKVVEQRYFADQEQVRRGLVAANRQPVTRALTVPQWFEGATLAIDAMIEFGRKVGGVAAEQSTASS